MFRTSLPILFLLNTSSYAQSFLREYQLPEGAEITAIAVDGSTGYYAAGIAGNDGLLIKFNEVGDMVWMHRYQGFADHPSEPGQLQYEMHCAAVVALPDGAHISGSAYGYDPEEHQRLDMRVNSEGEVVWMRHTGDQGDQHAYDADNYMPGGLVVGSRVTSTADHMWLEQMNMDDGSTIDQRHYRFANDTTLSGRLTHINFTINGLPVAGTHGMVASLSFLDLDVAWSHVYNEPQLQNPVGVRSVASGATAAAWAGHLSWYAQNGILLHSKALDPSWGTISAVTGRNWAVVLAGNTPDGRVWLSEITDQAVVLWTTLLDEGAATGVVKDLKLTMDGRMVIGSMRSQPARFALAVTQTNGSIECGSYVPSPDWTDVPIQSTGQIESVEPLPPLQENTMNANTEMISDINTITCVAVPVGTTGIQPPSASAMSFHPNPFSDHTTISFADPAPAGSTLHILDLQGKVVLAIDASCSRSILLPRKGLAAGTYIARLTSPDAMVLQRLVIE